MTTTIAVRATNARGGGPMNFMANSAPRMRPPQTADTRWTRRSRTPPSAPARTPSHTTGAAGAVYRTPVNPTIIIARSAFAASPLRRDKPVSNVSERFLELDDLTDGVLGATE